MTLNDLATADLLIEPESINLVLIRSMTRRGALWLQENVVSDPSQWFGNALAAHPSLVGQVIEGAEDAGLKVAA